MATEETNPTAAAAVARLRRWAVTEGNKIFKWGTPGDFERCRRFYRSKGVPERMIAGWCARLHKQATGHTPGNAPAERGAKK
jgi:hypothetical protein